MRKEVKYAVRIRQAIFGDIYGLSIFLGALLFFALFWRVEVFITDNLTLVNTLANLGSGQLHVSWVTVGPPNADTPGMHRVGNFLYGRNYGQLFLSLPALWLMQTAGTLFDPSVFLVGIWSIILVVFSRQVGLLFDEEREFVILGSVGSLAFFALNLWYATPISPAEFPIVAMQITSMVAAAFVGVFLYRTVAYLHDRRTAVFAGSVAVIGTPIAFWATVPKRHVFTALFAIIALYGYVVSREATEPKRVLMHRVAMYVAVALTAWIHAAEGLVLLLIVAPFDLLPKERRSRRSVALVAGAFFLSLLPFFLTNYFISGDPIQPPRMLPNYSPESHSVHLDTSGGGGGGGGSGGGGGGGGGSGGGSGGVGGINIDVATEVERIKDRVEIPSPSESLVVRVFDRIDMLLGFILKGVLVIFLKFDAVVQTFVYSSMPEFAKGDAELNLALLETTPILGALMAGVVVLRSRLSQWTSIRSETNGMATAFALAYAVLMSLMYLPRLPIHAQVTVRYIVPIIPMLLVVLVQLPPVRRTLERARMLVVASVAVTVLVGSQLAIAILATLGLTMGEGMQLFGIVAVFVGALSGIVLSYAAIRPSEKPIASSVAIGIAVGLGTIFVVLTGLVFFQYGDYALGFVGKLGELIAATT